MIIMLIFYCRVKIKLFLKFYYKWGRIFISFWFIEKKILDREWGFYYIYNDYIGDYVVIIVMVIIIFIFWKYK